MDETTPLFPGQADHEDENSIPTRRTSSSRIVTILIWSSVIISALTFLYNLTVYLVVKLSPYNDFLRWGTRDSVEALLPLSFLCAAVSLFGIFKLTVLNGSAWPLVSLILDPLIVFLFLLNPALDSYWIADWEHCDASRPDFPAPEFGAGCERFANAIRAVILVGLVFQMAIFLVIIYPYGNLRAIDAFFFGASASTESGLNTVDVKLLKTYQQVYIYVIPIISNLGFINILVVIVRLRWFDKRLKEAAPAFFRQRRMKDDAEAGAESDLKTATTSEKQDSLPNESQSLPLSVTDASLPLTTITFADNVHDSGRDKALYVPPPWQRDRGQPIVEVDDELSDCERTKSVDTQIANTGSSRRRFTSRLAHTDTIERVASSMFVIGPSASHGPKAQTQPLDQSLSQQLDLPELSSHATIGRNSQFHNLTTEDRELLGGIEYRSLKLLLKIVTGYFFGLQLFGAICLVGWIQHANPKYREYLAECGQGSVWWGFYSAQTMVNNLGFTLTPDSMISFQDATFPLIVMSFLAYAGNTFYPCLLRFIIWTMFKLCPHRSSMKEPLSFLLNHPRRCYTLLFPSKPTWVLFGILFTMNFVDIILILVLDLHNPAVNNLPAGPRVLASIFQAASARHTGTATFNLANVNPAVQFSLLVMMYIAIFPIAISVRASNTYEERALGMYPDDATIDESHGRSYVLTHIRNQLTFDLWYIFLGIFCICIAESNRIMDPAEPAFAVFPIFFEVVSAYSNVGLSLGYPTVNTSLSGQFTVFSKLVVCAMMIRGRHRGLPYQLDRAILLPNERLDDTLDGVEDARSVRRMERIKRYHTS
ncbi:uncharacterized protein CDV56_103810 [Aspergillus thermomutatus]|uniref:Potassium transport protein n=1 Tax=Aspergillus thermomutatus TaxID=41047 RepID=A0A397G6S9_ASPTH|nr:uncharacterized protein CDV56_103810 [Aspergillus thermomutatus]RHZ45318.1 hypothetical protein CDV56_103810 [Aspergillus thermomutatus]